MKSQFAIKAVIFDMDGVIADTEPLWQEAEKRVFGTLGIDLSPAMLHSTMGLRCDEVVAKWFALKPWEGSSLQEVHDKIVSTVIDLIRKHAILLPGVLATIEKIKQANLRLGLASSSPMVLIEAMLNHLDIREKFEIVHSAEFEAFGKPHPAVYISAAKMLDVAPINCLAIEDSFNGLLAAKSAKMQCVIVPDMQHFEDPRWAIADLKLKSLLEFDLG